MASNNHKTTSKKIKTMEPRRYQLELLEYVTQRNGVLYLPTGSGKTYIAILALKRFSQNMHIPVHKGGKRAFYICNTVELARQQALEMKKYLNLNIGLYVGERGLDFWSPDQWKTEILKNHVLCGTAQVFVDMVNRNYIKLTDLSIVIFDECHNAVGGHPMHQFLSFFQNADPSNCPRIIGLTGVLIKSNKLGNIVKELDVLEATFRGNIVTVSSMEEFQNVMVYSTKPHEKIVCYSDMKHEFAVEKEILLHIGDCGRMVDAWELGSIPMKLTKNLAKLREPNKKNYVKNLLKDFIHQFNDFGLYTGSIAIMMLIVDFEIKKRQAETLALRNMYRCLITICERIRHLLVKQIQNMIDDDNTNCDTMDVILNFSTPKMRSLLLYLISEFQNKQPDDISCLIFVERRQTAKCIYNTIQKFVDATPELANVLRPMFIVGQSSTLQSIQSLLERKINKNVIGKFRDKEFNLLVCSSVLEEGIDIQACNYVFAFDPLRTFSSYIQSKGRARANQASFVIFSSKCDEPKVISQVRNYQAIHEAIKKFLIGRTLDDKEPTEEAISKQFVEEIKPFVIKNGARLDADSALQLISRYCQTLPSDSFGCCFPRFRTVSQHTNKKGFLVSLTLPLQSTVKETIVSDPMKTTKLSKISAAMKSCIKLYENGELNDNLLPITNHECIAKVSGIFFEHWKKYGNGQISKSHGSQQYRRLYERMCPAELYQAMPVVGEPCYAYEIKVVPEFEADEYDGHLNELMLSSTNYALVLRKRLPPLAQMPLFMTQGKIKVEIVKKPIQLCLSSARELDQLRMYHIMIFRDLLHECWKNFFVMDQRNEQNSFLLAPVRNGNIDWELVRNFQQLLPLRRYSVAERMKTKYEPDDFMGKVVNTWYSLNESDRYVVTKVLKDQTPSSQFQDSNFSSYAEFVDKKYEEQVVHKDQFLIEVKSLTSRRNFFINAKGKTRKNTSRKQARIVLIPEMCHNFMYPADLWLKALFLPSILQRLHYMLHAENLRVRINEFLGINKATLSPVYEPKPLFIDASLKRVVDDDGNAIDLHEEPQKLLNAFPSVKTNECFEVHSLFENNCPWKEYMEPINIDIIPNSVFPIEIDYYTKFVNNLVGDVSALSLDESNIYNNEHLNLPEKNPNVSNSAVAPQSIAPVPLEERRRIKILEHSFCMSADKVAAPIAEQCDFVAALTTAGSNDVFDMERFEVLGDSFLKFSISLYLMNKFPKWHEGYLTELKSKFVSNRNLLYCMLELDIPRRICSSSFKPNSEWVPPLVSIPNNIMKLLQLPKHKATVISPIDLYALELTDKDLLSGECTKDQLELFFRNCKQRLLTFSDEENSTIENDVNSFIYKETIADKVVADTLESILGVCVKSYGIHQSFRMLKFFGICKEIDEKSMLDLNLGSPLLRTNITSKEVDGFLINYEILEKNLGYKFRDRAYLLQALTHPSYPTNRLTGCYQELEFIGDAILDFLVSCYIFERCETMNPGKLTDLRSALVNNITLGVICVRHRFHLFLLSENSPLAESIKSFAEFQETQDHRVTDQVHILMEEQRNDCGNKNANLFNMAANIDVPKALGDIVEALIAAVYLDSKDLKVTWHVIYHMLEQELNQFMLDVPIDPVRQLFEYKGAAPKFSDPITDNEVVMVKCTFTCLNELNEVNGFGSNKTHAKKSAAKHALQILSRS